MFSDTIEQSKRKNAFPFQFPEEIENQIQNINHLESIHCDINLKTEPLEVQVTYSTKFYDDPAGDPVYPTRSKCRGAVLIINNRNFVNNILDPRYGSEVDVQNLISLFKQMHMVVVLHNDLTAKVIIF